jgi:hypothetical protein
MGQQGIASRRYGSSTRRTWTRTATTSITTDTAVSSVGVSNASPAAAITMAVKIGLRAHLNRPLVTSPVRSEGSTPIRHDGPIADTPRL